MKMDKRIKVIYEEGSVSEVYNPDTGRYEVEKIETDFKEFPCNVSIERDYEENAVNGRFTGKTIKVRFIQPVSKFKRAEYNGRVYQPTEWRGKKNRQSVTLEEVGD